ncbi:MAG: hypothetical protein ACFB6R_02235 [Alphaproteobacteria bacterium]
MDDIIERHEAWINDFEATVLDDRWERLEPWLMDNVRYIVAGTPFACSLTGRGAVLDGFAKSIRGFDRQFDRRLWLAVGTRSLPPNGVTARIWGQYDKAGLPPLGVPVLGHWFYEDGRIACMVDLYEEDTAEMAAAYQWLAAHGEGLDPSYA